jgi:hypothetical protein
MMLHPIHTVAAPAAPQSSRLLRELIRASIAAPEWLEESIGSTAENNGGLTARGACYALARS